MGFAGFVTSGVVPAMSGALRGRNERARMAEEQRRYDAAQSQQTAQINWQQEQAREAQRRQAMMDALTREVQMGGLKSQAERNAIDMARTTQQSEAYPEYVGPQGPGVYGVIEGQEPRYLGGVIPKPAGSGSGGAGALQQSQMVDGDGRPLVFDKTTGRYRPAQGEGVEPFRNPTEAQIRFGGLMPTVDAARADLAAMESPDALPALLARPPLIGNLVTTDAQRLYNNRLRRYMMSVYLVSGQAFPEKEWSRLERTWGYEPGDDERTLMDKARAREDFVRGLLRITPPQYRSNGAADNPGAPAAPTDSLSVAEAYQRWLDKQKQGQ